MSEFDTAPAAPEFERQSLAQMLREAPPIQTQEDLDAVKDRARAALQLCAERRSR